jgi:tetratricopeptide (TPR) repeat protein/transcriptional regulator with XRE-family HTH domain
MEMQDSDLSSFGTLLKVFRKRRGLTQQQLAEKLDVHRNTISTWEQGSFLPASKAIVLELARHLRLDEQESRQVLEASLTALTPHWLVPFPRNPFFTGREEILEALHRQLGVEQAGAITQSLSLHGLGGVGKTQIALEYAYRYALEYSAVFWIGAETEEQIFSSLLRIAQVLQLPARDHQDQQCIVSAVQRWLSTHGQWLLIWDNMEDLALLNHFLPSSRLGSILITTRHQVLGTSARGLELSPMEQEEGLLFLFRRAKVLSPDATGEHIQHMAARLPTEYAAASALVMDLGGLPLALDQAGAYLEETQCGLPAYLKLFSVGRAALLQLRGEKARDHPASVSTTFTLAITATAERHPAVWDLLCVCAFLQPDTIPEELFRQSGGHLGAPLQAICCDALEWNRVIAAASAYSLLHRQPAEQTLSLHRLVQAILLDMMTEAEREQWAQRVIRALDTMLPEVTFESEGEIWQQCERLLPHTLACIAAISDQAVDQNVVSVLRKAADYLRERAQYKQAEPLYEQALTLCKQILGSAHPLVAQTLNGLANLYVEQGKFQQAEALCQQALRIQEQTLGSHHHEIAFSLNTRANLYWRQGKYEQAVSCLQQALHIGEQAVGPKHPLVVLLLSRLGLLYWKLGKYGQAEPLLQQALSVGEQVLGPQHSQIVQPLNNLGLLYWKLGKYEQAELLHQRALHIWEQLFGPEYHRLAYVLTGLAIIYAEQRKYEQAEELFQRALHIREQTLGAEHYLVSSTLCNLAELYIEQEKYEQVEQLYQRAIYLCERGVGSEHPALAVPLYGLAHLFYTQEKYEQAEPLYQRALHIWEHALEYPEVVTVLNSLANLYLKQNRLEETEHFCQRALSVQMQHLDQQTPEMAQTLHNLALLRQRQGNLYEAIALAEHARLVISQSLGDDHPKTITLRMLCAQLVQEQENLSKEVPPQQCGEETLDPYMQRCIPECTSHSPQATAHAFLHEEELLLGFFDAYCELHPHAWCSSADLWQTYERWVEAYQVRFPLSRRAFAAHLKAHGCRPDRTNTMRIWRGITVVKQEQ